MRSSTAVGRLVCSIIDIKSRSLCFKFALLRAVVSRRTVRLVRSSCDSSVPACSVPARHCPHTRLLV